MIDEFDNIMQDNCKVTGYGMVLLTCQIEFQLVFIKVMISAR